jgi:hypothetical protein
VVHDVGRKRLAAVVDDLAHVQRVDQGRTFNGRRVRL